MTKEEAIRRIKAWNLDSDDMEVLSVVIPELAESGDERVRKELVNFILYKAGQLLDEETEHKYIAYLEKQKEQNVVPSRETILGIWELGNLWKENPEERDGLTQLQYIQKYWFEKCDYQKEQKPAEWSEEDEKNLYHCIELVRGWEVDYDNANSHYSTWLKSLRPHWKPSEEQMEALMLAIEGKCPPTSYMSRRLEDLYEGLANTYKVECKLEN